MRFTFNNQRDPLKQPGQPGQDQRPDQKKRPSSPQNPNETR